MSRPLLRSSTSGLRTAAIVGLLLVSAPSPAAALRFLHFPVRRDDAKARLISQGFYGDYFPYCGAGGPAGCGTHRGYDFSIPVGTPLYAAAPGVVDAIHTTDTKSAEYGGGGLWVRVRHAADKVPGLGQTFYVAYLHLSQVSVSVGDVVSTQTQIGLSGNTGSSGGPHLHLHIGTSVDYCGNDGNAAVDPGCFDKAHLQGSVVGGLAGDSACENLCQDVPSLWLEPAGYGNEAYGLVTTPAYAGQPLAHSFPSATEDPPLVMQPGQTIDATVDIKNVGTAAWGASTALGTTVPRDRASPFRAPSWPTDNRLAAASASVPPGATYTFAFQLRAPLTPGDYLESFGMVEDGVTWFGDAGGPPDGLMAIHIVVQAPSGGAGQAGAAGAGMGAAGAAGAVGGAGSPGKGGSGGVAGGMGSGGKSGMAAGAGGSSGGGAGTMGSSGAPGGGGASAGSAGTVSGMGPGGAPGVGGKSGNAGQNAAQNGGQSAGPSGGASGAAGAARAGSAGGEGGRKTSRGTTEGAPSESGGCGVGAAPSTPSLGWIVVLALGALRRRRSQPSS